MSEDTFSLLQNRNRYQYRKVDIVAIKGRQKQMYIIEIFDGSSPRVLELKKSTKKSFERGVGLYRQKRYDEALEVFTQVLPQDPLDAASSIYINRCLEKQGIESA